MVISFRVEKKMVSPQTGKSHPITIVIDDGPRSR